MGHYCYICSEKLSGGVTPTCCDNIECYCWGCWERLLKVTMPVELQQRIRDETLDFPGVITANTLRCILVWANQKPKCPECKTELTEDMIKDY